MPPEPASSARRALRAQACWCIRNGPGERILGQHAAVFTVSNSVVQDCGGTGLAVDGGSVADLTDCTMQRNAIGLDVFTKSAVILRGAVDIVDNLTASAAASNLAAHFGYNPPPAGKDCAVQATRGAHRSKQG